MRSPQPLYHATSAMPVEGMPLGWTARTLHLRHIDGRVTTFTPLTEYMVAHPTYCATWQDTVARGVGLFWDFCRAQGTEITLAAQAEDRDVQRSLYRAFAGALITGTVVGGMDPSGLFWPRLSLRRAKEIINGVERFAQWWWDEEENRGRERSALVPEGPKDRKRGSDRTFIARS